MRNNDVRITFLIFLTDVQHLYINKNTKNGEVENSFAVQYVMSVLHH